MAKGKKSAVVVVGIIMGSKSDWPTMELAARMLEEFGIGYEAEVVSAHRTPDKMMRYAETAQARGLKLIIAGAGGAAHLAGIPVATFAVGEAGAKNAGLFAAAVLALEDAGIAAKLERFRSAQTKGVMKDADPRKGSTRDRGVTQGRGVMQGR
jgi:5-(carboxyamino)imidazole ribonucleotide mutase